MAEILPSVIANPANAIPNARVQAVKYTSGLEVAAGILKDVEKIAGGLGVAAIQNQKNQENLKRDEELVKAKQAHNSILSAQKRLVDDYVKNTDPTHGSDFKGYFTGKSLTLFEEHTKGMSETGKKAVKRSMDLKSQMFEDHVYAYNKRKISMANNKADAISLEQNTSIAIDMTPIPGKSDPVLETVKVDAYSYSKKNGGGWTKEAIQDYAKRSRQDLPENFKTEDLSKTRSIVKKELEQLRKTESPDSEELAKKTALLNSIDSALISEAAVQLSVDKVQVGRFANYVKFGDLQSAKNLLDNADPKLKFTVNNALDKINQSRIPEEERKSLEGDEPTFKENNIPDSIVDKAIAHAKKRMDEGKSPFLSGTSKTPRGDSRKKGDGFLGKLKRSGGGYSTELSISVNINGEEVEIPTLVPGLTKEEKNILLTDNAIRENTVSPQVHEQMTKQYTKSKTIFDTNNVVTFAIDGTNASGFNFRQQHISDFELIASDAKTKINKNIKDPVQRKKANSQYDSWVKQQKKNYNNAKNSFVNGTAQKWNSEQTTQLDREKDIDNISKTWGIETIDNLRNISSGMSGRAKKEFNSIESQRTILNDAVQMAKQGTGFIDGTEIPINDENSFLSVYGQLGGAITGEADERSLRKIYRERDLVVNSKMVEDVCSNQFSYDYDKFVKQGGMQFLASKATEAGVKLSNNEISNGVRDFINEEVTTSAWWGFSSQKLKRKDANKKQIVAAKDMQLEYNQAYIAAKRSGRVPRWMAEPGKGSTVNSVNEYAMRQYGMKLKGEEQELTEDSVYVHSVATPRRYSSDFGSVKRTQVEGF